MAYTASVAPLSILVTGNEGYIGSIVTAYLTALDHRVIGLDNGIFRHTAFTPRTRPAVRQLYKDIRQVQTADLEGIDSIVHLAGLSNDPVGELDPSLTEEINYKATARLAEKARAAKVRRFLFSSSCSMYGISDQTLVDETSPLAPGTAYAHSKVAAEAALSNLADQHFSPILLRNATAFGPSPRMRFDLAVQNLLGVGYTTQQISLLSDGTPWRPFIHVEDIADAFAFFIKAPLSLVHNQAFNVGRDDNNIQIKKLAQLINQLLPVASVSLSPDASTDQRSYRVSFKKIKQLGWQPRHSIQEGLHHMLSLFQKIKFDHAQFTQAEYHTVHFYKQCLAQKVLDPAFYPLSQPQPI